MAKEPKAIDINFTPAQHDLGTLVCDIIQELDRARGKFPGDNVTFFALVEEVGELAKAMFSEPRENVKREAIQTAVMAMRVVLDGDVTIEDWRRSKNLDRLVKIPDQQEIAIGGTWVHKPSGKSGDLSVRHFADRMEINLYTPELGSLLVSSTDLTEFRRSA